MKNLFENSKTELDLTSIGKILSTGAAAGIAIANLVGKRSNVGGIIGTSICLLIGGVLVAIEKDESSHNFKNNQ